MIERATQPSILESAARIVDSERQSEYGSPQQNLALIAGLWSEMLMSSGKLHVDLSENDVCLMMILLKIARLNHNPTHVDSQIDVCGYARLMQRVQEQNPVGPAASGS